MTTLLLVDDDADVRSMLALALGDEGFRVVAAADAETGLYEFSSYAVDAVLVDIRLPGMSGLELCREVRRRGRTPVVAVTAQSSWEDVLAGFEAGADDYVIKPVAVSDLVRRLSALVDRSRAEAAAPSTVEAGDLVIHLPGGEAERAGQRVPLTPVEARLLAVLAERAGTVIRREELAERLWGPGRVDDLRLVDAHVEGLRAKLGTAGNGSSILPALDTGYQLAV